jgi:hypothetical protein
VKRSSRRLVVTYKRQIPQNKSPVGRNKRKHGEAHFTTSSSMEESNISCELISTEQLEMVEEPTRASCLVQSIARHRSTSACVVTETDESDVLVERISLQQLESAMEPVHADCNMPVQTDLFGTDIDSMRTLVDKVQNERDSLVKKLQEVEMFGSARNFGMASLVNDDERCKFYTGLPYSMVVILYNFLLPHFNKSATSVKPMDEMFILLIKLRLNLLNEDIAYRFGISSATVSRIFHKWLNVMYEKLSVLICWPDRESVRQTLPVVFHTNYSKLVCIIDCTDYRDLYRASFWVKCSCMHLL